MAARSLRGYDNECAYEGVSGGEPVADAAGWRFELGEFVTHNDQSLPSLVMGRVRTTKGCEIYGVRSFAILDPCRDRMIEGDCLKPIDDEAWSDCLLAGTQYDPRVAV